MNDSMLQIDTKGLEVAEARLDAHLARPVISTDFPLLDRILFNCFGSFVCSYIDSDADT